jgi:hypothetical protein
MKEEATISDQKMDQMHQELIELTEEINYLKTIVVSRVVANFVISSKKEEDIKMVDVAFYVYVLVVSVQVIAIIFHTLK